MAAAPGQPREIITQTPNNSSKLSNTIKTFPTTKIKLWKRRSRGNWKYKILKSSSFILDTDLYCIGVSAVLTALLLLYAACFGSLCVNIVAGWMVGLRQNKKNLLKTLCPSKSSLRFAPFQEVLFNHNDENSPIRFWFSPTETRVGMPAMDSMDQTFLFSSAAQPAVAAHLVKTKYNSILCLEKLLYRQLIIILIILNLRIS